MKTILNTIWNLFRNNLVLKIMAVLFAVILWSYVISEMNPIRTRDLDNINIRYENMDKLTANNLYISQILETVDVRVEIRQSEVKSLSDQDVIARVDLGGINSPGEYTRKIEATLPNGLVSVVNPATVSFYVDRYDTKAVPVNINLIGSVPNGYHADEPVITPSVVAVSGAYTDVKNVASAVCNIDLNGLTHGYNKSMEIDLLDNNGNIIDKTLFTDIPSVIVNLTVQSKKTVPVDVQSSIIDQDYVAAGYEVADITCLPASVDIAGDAGKLLGINSISLAPYSVSGKSASESVLLDYQLPEGVSVLTTEKAQIFITIREITRTKTYTNIGIEKKNLSSGLKAKISQGSVDVTVVAGLSRLSKLSRSEIVPFVDLDGLKPGVYSLNVLFEIPEGFSEENFSASIGTVTVTVY